MIGSAPASVVCFAREPLGKVPCPAPAPHIDGFAVATTSGVKNGAAFCRISIRVQSFGRLQGSRTPRLVRPPSFTARRNARIVSRRVPHGELKRFAEFPPTVRLTQNAESESPRRFVFSRCPARTYGE